VAVRIVSPMNDGQDEARKADTMDADIDTKQLVAALSDFDVDETRLKNDVRRHFLPRPRTVSAKDGRPRVGYWSPAAVRRAHRLYELRKRGAKGEMLRLLLFLEDGWGWEHVRETCVEGVRRATASSLSGLGRYAPKGDPDGFAIDAVREHQHDALERTLGPDSGARPTSEPMTRFVLGLLQNGVPLEGGTAKSLIEPMSRLFFPQASDEEVETGSWVFDNLATMLDLRTERLVALVEAADADQVEPARRSVFEIFGQIADALRRQSGDEPRGVPVDAVVVWDWLAKIPAREFAKNPAGATLPQILGYVVAISLAFDAALHELAEFANGMMSLLPVMMQTVPAPTE
jgi:hypothetical protein